MDKKTKTKQTKNPRLNICCLQETHFRSKNTQTESDGMEKDISCNGNQKNWGSYIRQNKV